MGFIDYDKQLYLHKLTELQARLSGGGHFILVNASSILRQLLLDSTPLVNKVKREFGIKLTFIVTKSMLDSPVFSSGKIPMPKFYINMLDPGEDPEGFREAQVNIDGLLGTLCLYIEDESFTVRNIIKTCAHILGGVHSSDELDHREQILLGEMRSIPDPSRGYTVAVGLLLPISHVVLRGLFPLTEAVKESLRNSS